MEFALDCPPFAMVCAGFMESSETTFVWVADKAVDGEWHRAKVVQQSTDGSVTVETLETNEQVETTSEKLLLANELPEEGVEDMTRPTTSMNLHYSTTCAPARPRVHVHGRYVLR